MPDGYQKISVNLSNDVVEAARAMAEDDAVTLTEIVRRAISTHRFIDEQTRAGKQIYVHDPKSEKSERVIFL